MTLSAGTSRTLPGAAAALITVVFWGSAFAGIRAGLHSYSPTHLALLRFLTASVACAVIVVRPGMRRPALRDVPLIALLGLLGFAFYNIALNIGEQSIPAGPAALLIQTLPIWTALAAILPIAGSVKLVVVISKLTTSTSTAKRRNREGYR